MRPAKLTALLALVLAAVTLAATADARRTPAPVEDGTLTVRDGKGAVALRFKGSLIGRLAKGRIAVQSSPMGTAAVVVRGWERRQMSRSGLRVVYSGTGIRFRIADERRLNVQVSGKGLNFSAVGLGEGWIDGWGDPEAGVFFDGSYALNGVEHPSLPNERTRFELAVPAPE